MVMYSKCKRFAIIIIVVLRVFNLGAFTGTVKFSDDFYAAQKYFYTQAKIKFPKLNGDKSFPEIPIRGIATNDELKKISPLLDFFEARLKFLNEVLKYPEQIYPEIFTFLNGHPGLTLSSSNKPKFEALEKYFYPFFYTFSTDKHYSFNPDIKVNPCPLVFCLKDEKKNSISFNISNNSKKNFEFNVNESLTQSYITISNKRPISVKAGATTSIKLSVNTAKLKTDSTFKCFNFVFADPAQPRVKIVVPVILLPSKDFLNLPPHFFDLTLSYSTFFKHISLQKEKATYPENCPNGDCSGKKDYSLRSNDKLVTEYKFGDLCTIQYNMISNANTIYSIKNNSLRFSYNEFGNLEGMDRNCPGVQPGTEIYCPPETPNNGKELYGSRRIDFKLFLPTGKTHELKITIRYNDLPNQPQLNSELSWLQEKKIIVVLTDNSKKQLIKEFATTNPFTFDKKDIPPGTYTVSVFPAAEDSQNLHPSFDIQHLNHANPSRFDFTLNGSFMLLSNPSKK